MALWLRFEAAGAEHIGTLDGDTVTVWRGDMFDQAQPTAQPHQPPTQSIAGSPAPARCVPWGTFHTVRAWPR